jgi:hypothetical protein
MGNFSRSDSYVFSCGVRAGMVVSDSAVYVLRFFRFAVFVLRFFPCTMQNCRRSSYVFSLVPKEIKSVGPSIRGDILQEYIALCYSAVIEFLGNGH